MRFSENWAVTQKRPIVERNGRNFGPLGWGAAEGGGKGEGGHVTSTWVFLTLNMSRSFGGHLVHFSKNWAVTQKRLVVERNGRKLGSFSVLFENRGRDSIWLIIE